MVMTPKTASLIMPFTHFEVPNVRSVKNNRYFLQPEFQCRSSEFHLDLESITFKTDLVQIDCFQYFPV